MKIGNIECYGVIYKNTNINNNKCYIGQTTVGFDRRYSGNLYKNTKNSYLKRSIEKYGIENFEIIKIFDVAFSRNELNIKEMYWIDYYNSNVSDSGYNLTEGGEGSIGWHPSEETRNKMSENHWDCSGKNHPNYGKHLSEETRKKQSEIKKGKNPLDNLSEDVLKERNKKIGKWVKENRIGKNHPNAISIICVTTGRIFDTTAEGAKYYNIKSRGNITECLKGNRKTAGKLSDGTKLVWRYITIIEL